MEVIYLGWRTVFNGSSNVDIKVWLLPQKFAVLWQIALKKNSKKKKPAKTAVLDAEKTAAS